MAETLEDKLAKIKRGDDAILKLFQEHMKSGSPMYTADFLLLGVAKRTLALSSGFRGLIETRNFTCAAALVRMQVDPALRVFAGTLVPNTADYAMAVLRGDPINK
ncbi:MAG TPA: hypothetical protein VEX61_12365, partial [Burkholderiales bacterium]|nr:hypothetical protein [Burkholderiales bacterium]